MGAVPYAETIRMDFAIAVLAAAASAIAGMLGTTGFRA